MHVLYRLAHRVAAPLILREIAPFPTEPEGEGGFWVHVASVGELHGVAPFLKQIRGVFPLWVSTTTARGYERAVRLLGEEASVFRFPLDHPPRLSRVFAHRPRALALVETELWPHLLMEATRRDVPLFLFNGRITPRTFHFYRVLGTFSPLLRRFRRLFVQTQWDAWRFWRLGAPRDRLRVTGNWKRYFPPVRSRVWRREDLGIPENAPVVLFASLRSREMEVALAAMEHLRGEVPGLRWILAPRHFGWLSELLKRLEQRGFSVRRWREGSVLREEDVLVVDVLGELVSLYPVADCVVVGGTFAPYGGHNLMEPVHSGRPVVFGPFTHHVSDMRDEVLRYCAGVQTDGEGLAPLLAHVFQDPAFRERLTRGVQALRAAGARRVEAIVNDVEGILAALHS